MAKQFISLTEAITHNRLRTGSAGQGKDILRSSEVLPSAHKRHIGAEAASRETTFEPITREGQIEGIRFRCKCGEIVEVYFEYEPLVAEDTPPQLQDDLP